VGEMTKNVSSKPITRGNQSLLPYCRGKRLRNGCRVTQAVYFAQRSPRTQTGAGGEVVKAVCTQLLLGGGEFICATGVNVNVELWSRLSTKRQTG